MTIYMPPGDYDMDKIFGRGMNVVTARPVGETCVSGITTIEKPAPIGTEEVRYALVDDSASYSNLLSTAASMSGSGPGWSASSSMSYLREQTGSDTSISLVWMRMLQSQKLHADMSNAAISPAALDVLKTHGPSTFVALYGTHCAIGVVYGGSFIGRLRIVTSTASDKKVIAAAIKGSLSGFGMSGEVSSDFKQQLQSQSTSYDATLESNGTGTGIIKYDTFDLGGVQKALSAFKLPPDPARGVEGTAFAVICQTWDEFPQIAEALQAMGQPNALQFTAENATLDALADEFATLDYVRNTVEHLRGSPDNYAVPSYNSLLLTMSAAAASHQAQIQALSMHAVSRLTVQGVEAMIVSQKILPLLEIIARGEMLVRVSWQLDGAFQGDRVDTRDFEYKPNSGDVQVVDSEHGDPSDPITIMRKAFGGRGLFPGPGEPQHMTLYFNVTKDDTGKAELNTRMHWRDPYGPPGDADYCGSAELSAFPVTSTAIWSMFPWNQMSATLVGLDPSIQVAAPPAPAAVARAAEPLMVVAELVG